MSSGKCSIQIEFTDKSATVFFSHLDLSTKNHSSPILEFVVEKKPIELKEGTSYNAQTILIDHETDTMKQMVYEAQQLFSIPEVERLARVLNILRSRVGYAFDKVVENLSEINPQKAQWIKENTGLSSQSWNVPLSKLIENGYGICRHLAVAYLWLAQRAGLRGVILYCPENRITNIQRTDTGENLFKSVDLGCRVAPHSWVEIQLSDGSWVPVDPSVNLVGDTQESLAMFKRANYQAHLQIFRAEREPKVLVPLDKIAPFAPGQTTTSGTCWLELTGLKPMMVIGPLGSKMIPPKNIPYSGSAILRIFTGEHSENFGLGLDIRELREK